MRCSPKDVREGGLKVIKRAENKIESGEFYEAHQLYKTIYFRYMNQKRWGDALFVVFHGAKKLFLYNQNNSAADLSLLVLETYIECKAQVNEENRDRIIHLFSLFPSNHSLKNRFIFSCLRWSQREGVYCEGDPVLLLNFGLDCLKESKYLEAQEYFLKCYEDQSVRLWTETLNNCASDSYNKETIECLLTIAILKLLSIGDLRRANLLYSRTLSPHNDVYERSLLIKFCGFLLKTCEYNAPIMFKSLCDEFAPSLDLLEGSHEQLQLVGVQMFNLPSNKDSFADVVSRFLM